MRATPDIAARVHDALRSMSAADVAAVLADIRDTAGLHALADHLDDTPHRENT